MSAFTITFLILSIIFLLLDLASIGYAIREGELSNTMYSGMILFTTIFTIFFFFITYIGKSSDDEKNKQK